MKWDILHLEIIFIFFIFSITVNSYALIIQNTEERKREEEENIRKYYVLFWSFIQRVNIFQHLIYFYFFWIMILIHSHFKIDKKCKYT